MVHRLQFHEASYDVPKGPIFREIPISSSKNEHFSIERRSLSEIALRGFFLGVVFGLCFAATLALRYVNSRLWRVPFFIATFCIFHFLEFWTTAQYNTNSAFVSSYLLELFTDGGRYSQAHTMAFVETFIAPYLIPKIWKEMSRKPVLILGFLLLALGQSVRSLAMVHAGVSFNHTVRTEKTVNHVLVSTGVYRIFRHPSYFGFFWWVVGIQLILGNLFSLVAHAGTMYWFFKDRIECKI
jgi:protein-S-isoprenylcysteine O-methyltransferase